MFEDFLSSEPALPTMPRNRREVQAASRKICLYVARDFGVGLDALLAPTRGSPHVALARQAAMYLCHVGLSLSFAAIGHLFERDRTTVAHACRVIEDQRDDTLFDRRLSALERVCAVVSRRTNKASAR